MRWMAPEAMVASTLSAPTAEEVLRLRPWRQWQPQREGSARSFLAFHRDGSSIEDVAGELGRRLA